MNKHWYKDNWNGSIKEFGSLREAKKNASKETGSSITIYDTESNIVCFVKASGYTPN